MCPSLTNPADPGKLGELIGSVLNTTAGDAHAHIRNGTVYPGDAVFAVVPYSDTWIDDFYDTSQEPLDEDEDGFVDPDKSGFAHGGQQHLGANDADLLSREQ